ncbi:uncharacterized protein PGTG_02754 [Puccinia graminis f. sp. tritici CRL 75-36-700-3]|uniref:Tet-like 2OG-Fe(II) oxygenase domain-containing protein n=1 Tax=Puccinia graminis f. sp. tritici (strain CRL 75-36-700-3 / race SCCL) TaxID=418459 RepID=E3JW88_PUCGT|nr:uncharacterized protein PGTG_02754 [Puccinia graminis f. sp. tritici CRL 75-36-700-3]EFP76313.2 hypothetical protein PGTG_02754 [Puccinia graminis f. sp. tritici CRL 75-36-700-3]
MLAATDEQQDSHEQSLPNENVKPVNSQKTNNNKPIIQFLPLDAGKRPAVTSNELQHEVEVDDFSTKPFYWKAKHIGLELYPNINQIKNHYVRRPRPEELQAASDVVTGPGWKLFDRGLNILFDGNKKDGRIIAVIEFIKWDDLDDKTKDEINLVSTFLHDSTRFVHDIKSQCWGGNMWAIGWRKAMVKAEIIGRYIKQAAVNLAPEMFDELFKSSASVARTLGNMFQKMGSIPFKNNQEIMRSNGIPDFADLSFTDRNTKLAGSPHITYTTNGFYNSPHEDKKDKSDFAFALFVPTFKETGQLASPSDGPLGLLELSGGLRITNTAPFHIQKILFLPA